MSSDNDWWSWILIGTIVLLTTPMTYIPIASSRFLLKLRDWRWYLQVQLFSSGGSCQAARDKCDDSPGASSALLR